MKIRLHNFRVLTFLLLMILFSGKSVAQCSITASTNASSLTCGSGSLNACNGILYIGDGSTSMSVIMNAALNLTCLGSIQLIVKNNASIDFSSGNDYLTLANGSSISFEGTGTLIGGNCNASERIYIGSNLVASCNGNGPGSDYSFSELIKNGGYNIVAISPGSASVCGSGSFSFTATAIPSSTATIRWYDAAIGGILLQTGVSGSSSTYTTSTISTTKTYYAEATIGTFTTPRKAVTVTVNPIPSTPIIGTIAQPDCKTATGSIILSGLQAGGTINQTGSATANYSIIGTSMTISGLSPGTYNYTVTNASGCISSTLNNITINPVPTIATWSVVSGSGSWTNGPPNSSQAVVFNGNYSSAGDVSGCSCQVNSGVNVIFNSPNTLTVGNEVTVLGTGTLTFKSDLGIPTSSSASLVQLNNVVTNNNSGNITYERVTNTTVRNTDYTYWSSPVYPQILNNLSTMTAGGTFGSYQVIAGSEGWVNESSGASMVTGKGYIARGPDYTSGPPPPPSQYFTTFKGVPNNGVITIATIFPNKSYLIGNPYPSAINADIFLNENAGVLDGTLYFWTHNTQRGIGVSNPGSGLYAYSSDDYASYNITGGVGIAPDITAHASSSGANQNIPTGKIAAGQGFFASSLVSPISNTIVYNNDIRVSGTSGNNSQFFKTSNTKKGTAISTEKDRIWLDLSNSQGAFKQTLIGYITGATNDYDDRFDGESFDGNEFVDFYSVLQDKNLTIQGRALPFDENDLVPLGFRSSIDGDFTINIDQVDGLLTNQSVFIEDKLTNMIADLKKGNYTFTTVAGTFNDRFVLTYTNNNSFKTLATAGFDAKSNKVLVSTKNKQIKVNSFAETMDMVSIYDLLGRQIYQKTNVNTNELSIANLGSSHQTLVVKTSLQNGTVSTDKIIY